MQRLTQLAVTALGLLALLLAAPGCRAARERSAAPTAEPLVSAVQLARELDALGDGAVVLDVRSIDEYRAGHVRGAIWLPLAEWESLSFATETGLAHESAWRERIGALGIDGRQRVFVYDGGKMTQAARVWFLLQHFGAASVAVIDGGFPLIAEAAERDGPALSTEPASRPPARFEPCARGSIGLMERRALREALERGDVQVLDVRTVAEYQGLDLRGNPRGGHIPGAINLPHTRLLDERGRLRSIEELRALLGGAGFERGRPVVTHCDGGGRAALAALAAARAGYGPVLSYYLSFGDWSRDAACPVIQE